MKLRRADRSSRAGEADALGDFRAAVALDQGDLVLALEVEPELRPVAEVATQAHRRVSRDPAPSVQDVGDPAGGHAEVEGEPIGAQTTRFEFELQEPSGVCDEACRSRLWSTSIL
jgi:hypothetical protein